MKLKYVMLSLLLIWVTMKTAAQPMYGYAPDNRHSHSALLNIHHPGGSRLHSYHRRGPHGNGVLYVHRQGSPVPSPLIIHRISSPYNQHSKLSHQRPRAAEDMENSANRSADTSFPIDSPGSGRAVALSSVLLAPTDYFNTDQINGISDRIPVETIVYPLAKAIQKHYVPRQPPFYVRLPPEYPLHHIPVAMVVTPPAAPQYFRSSNWYPPKDEIPLEERTPSLPTPRPSSLPPRPSLPPSAAPPPPLYFPTHNYYTFVPAENQTSDHQPPIPALHPPHHFPYNNCYVPAPESNERTSFSLQSSEPPHYSLSGKYEPYDPSELQMQQNNARSEENVDPSSRSSEQAPPYYFPNSGYQLYDPSKLQAHSKSEARTLPHHHASYHETISHTPLLIHGGQGEGIHKHIIIHHSKPVPFAHSDLAPTLYDDVHLHHGEHSTYLHEEPSLHGHLSLNLGRNAPTYDVTNMPRTYDGFHQPLYSLISSYPYGYGDPSHLDYSSIPHVAKHSIPFDTQQNKQQNVPYLLRRLRSFEESKHKSTTNLGNLALESEKGLTISLPVDISNTAENETNSKLQKKEAIPGDVNPDFHPETAKLLDLSQVLNPNEVRKRLILEAILSRKASSEEENIHKIISPIESDKRSFSKDLSGSSALHQAEMGDEAHVKQLHKDMATDSFVEVKDVSLQSVHHEPEKVITSLDTLWQKMRAKRSKRQTSQEQNNNTSLDSKSRTLANARSQEEGIGFVIGFLDPELYNYYFGSENNENIASDQNDYLTDHKQVSDKPQVPIPLYYRQRKTNLYVPVARDQYDTDHVPNSPYYRQSKTDSNNPVAKDQYDYDDDNFPVPPYYRQRNMDSYIPVTSDQKYYHLRDYKQVSDKTGQVPILVYYRQKETDPYNPVNLMSYKETATSDSRSVKVTDPNITTKNADGYWTYNKTARYNTFGGDSFPGYYEPYPVRHNSDNPELVPVPYHQFSEHVMPHRFLNIYSAKMLHPKPYPIYSYSSDKLYDRPTSNQQTSKYYADLSDYAEEPQMNARAFSNTGPANAHPIRHHHHPNRYNTHIPGILQANVRPHDANVHPIAHHPRPGRYYAHISQEPELDTRPYHNLNGVHIPPTQHQRPSRYYAHLHRYPHETRTDARSSHNIDDIQESPARQHYTSRYYEHTSGYPPRDTKLYDYNDERGYYHPSRYFDPAPYDDTDLIGPHHLGVYEYPYQPKGDVTLHQVDSIHQHPARYHRQHRYHERYHGHPYQPGYHVERFHPSRYHHSRRYQEHVHGNAYRSLEEVTPNSKIPETSNQTSQMRNDKEAVEYPQKMQSGAMTEFLPGYNYASKYYAGGSPKSQIALVSFFSTDKESPYPIRFHRLDPYGPTYHPSQYMNSNTEGGYNTAGYFSKMGA